MRLRRFGTFTGGIDLPDERGATLRSVIVPAATPSRLCVPLAIADAPPARPVVEPGAYVSRGERLAAGQGVDQVDVFAPLAGRFTRLGEALLPAHPTGWRVTPMMELAELDASVGILPLPDHYDWQAADDVSLRQRIAEGSLTTFRRPVTALAGWIAAARRAGVDTLIANVMENTPYATADHRLLAEQGMDVVRGLAILARAVGAGRVMLAVDHRRTATYAEAVGPARFYDVQTIALARKYPIGADAILVKVLTRRGVPLGGRSEDVGVVVTDAGTCWAAYRWVSCGEHPTARVVAVAGPRVANAGNYLIPFGAEIAEVLAGAGIGDAALPVAGSAMTGRGVLDGAVVGPGASELLGLPPLAAAVPTPCIRCGWCTDNCPARLNVAALNDDFELARVEAAERRGALACVGCGICTYVCPARLPLSWRVGQLAQTIHRQREHQGSEKGS